MFKVLIEFLDSLLEKQRLAKLQWGNYIINNGT